MNAPVLKLAPYALLLLGGIGVAFAFEEPEYKVCTEAYGDEVCAALHGDEVCTGGYGSGLELQLGDEDKEFPYLCLKDLEDVETPGVLDRLLEELGDDEFEVADLWDIPELDQILADSYFDSALDGEDADGQEIYDYLDENFDLESLFTDEVNGTSRKLLQAYPRCYDARWNLQGKVQCHSGEKFDVYTNEGGITGDLAVLTDLGDAPKRDTKIRDKSWCSCKVEYPDQLTKMQKDVKICNSAAILSSEMMKSRAFCYAAYREGASKRWLLVRILIVLRLHHKSVAKRLKEVARSFEDDINGSKVKKEEALFLRALKTLAWSTHSLTSEWFSTSAQDSFKARFNSQSNNWKYYLKETKNAAIRSAVIIARLPHIWREEHCARANYEMAKFSNKVLEAYWATRGVIRPDLGAAGQTINGVLIPFYENNWELNLVTVELENLLKWYNELCR